MSHEKCAIAILDQRTWRLIRPSDPEPPGSVVFRSPAELEISLTTETMDRIRGQILREITHKSESKKIAALKLWHVMTLGAEALTRKQNPGKKTDFFGNPKNYEISPIELIQLLWCPGANHMADFFQKKLPPQAKQILNMLIEDGRRIWTGDQADQVIERRESEIISKNGALWVFRYYKSRFFQQKLLGRLSYADFANRVEQDNDLISGE